MLRGGYCCYGLILIALVLLPLGVLGQRHVRVSGLVRDTAGRPLPDASIVAVGASGATLSDANGQYHLRASLPQDAQSLRIQFMLLGHATVDTLLRVDAAVNAIACNVTLEGVAVDIATVHVASGQQRPAATVERLTAKGIIAIPTAIGGVESLLKTLPGVSARNELSSQYSVRGGSFDENLVYVDGVEVYRPSLVRSGNQEGLSAINPDLVSSLDFSAGAFPARHGDKMSSVLSVHYRTPKRYGARLQLGLLENRAALEGYLPSARVGGLLGVRYKNTRLLLNTTDTKGDYRPNYIDLQGKLMYTPVPGLQVSLLGGLMRNEYHFVPSNKTTVFGAGAGSLLTMNVYYEGQERDAYLSGFASLGVRWQQPGSSWWTGGHLGATFLAESETFDILGEYWLSDIQDSSAPIRPHDSVANVGIGGSLDHARNYFQAQLYTATWRAGYAGDDWQLEGGVESSMRHMGHDLREWHLLDSAGYALPRAGLGFRNANLVRDARQLELYRHAAYVQGSWQADWGGNEITVELGGRLSAREQMRAIRFSPRGAITLVPARNRALSFYAAGGLYYQYPFYREMRDRQGALHPSLRPQRALQALIGARWRFEMFDHPFHLQTELYMKRIAHLVPYSQENLGLQYEATDVGQGRIMGWDAKLHGELVAGAESWVSVSLLRAQMRFTEPVLQPDGVAAPTGWMPMPSDQRFALSLFLEDHIPHAPYIRVHLSAHYATGIPVGQPDAPYGKQVRLPSYKRVDIGFSYILKDAAYTAPWLSRASWLRELSAMLEVYNLLNFANTASYLWVTVPQLNGQRGRLAVPNYLTARSLNVRLVWGF